jgi:hypothetical protein
LKKKKEVKLQATETCCSTTPLPIETTSPIQFLLPCPSFLPARRFLQISFSLVLVLDVSRLGGDVVKSARFR